MSCSCRPKGLLVQITGQLHKHNCLCRSQDSFIYMPVCADHRTASYTCWFGQITGKLHIHAGLGRSQDSFIYMLVCADHRVASYTCWFAQITGQLHIHAGLCRSQGSFIYMLVCADHRTASYTCLFVQGHMDKSWLLSKGGGVRREKYTILIFNSDVTN